MAEPTDSMADRTAGADILGQKALAFLSKNRLGLTPRNFELVFEVLVGKDKSLRQAFLDLPKPVSQASLTSLESRFLIERPALGRLRSVASDALQSLDQLRKQLDAGIITSSGRDADGNELLGNLDAQLRLCAEALQAVGTLLTVQSEEAPGQEHLTVQLTSGLPDYAALDTRLKTLVAEGLSDQGVSLLLCRIEGLEPLERNGLSKVADYMKNTLARFSSRLLAKGDTAYWTAPDELGLLIGATSESYLGEMGQKISRVLANAEGVVGRSIKSVPKMRCHFGCARSYRPVAPAQLYGAARQALQRAELTESPLPVFMEVSADLATLRRYEALYGRRAR